MPFKSPDYAKRKERRRWSFYKERNIWRIELTEITVWRRRNVVPAASLNTSEDSKEGEASDKTNDDPTGILLSPRPPTTAPLWPLRVGGQPRTYINACHAATELVPHPNNPIYEVRFELMHEVLERFGFSTSTQIALFSPTYGLSGSPLCVTVMMCSLIRTEKSTLEYIAAKFFQQIQFFSLKMQKNNGPVMFRSGTIPPPILLII